MKKSNPILFCLAIFAFLLSGCADNGQIIKVENTSQVEFKSATVKINKIDLNGINQQKFNNLVILDKATKSELASQLIDEDRDGEYEALIFQASVDVNSTKEFVIKQGKTKSDSSEIRVYSRFVPERTDDYAWENDKVAFRTYGPVAQKLAEEHKPNGTLSSGLDCWLKRVDYPIINKWYKKYADGTGTYHEDTGEGLDNFHVGKTRGCGGIGVFINDELYTSKNFTDYKTWCNGSLRTSFVLDYADWQADSLTISEKKHISLDLGSNLMKITEEIEGTDHITIGLTLHENDGVTSVDTVNGWFSYWQPHGDAELGTGIIINQEHYIGYTKVESQIPDKSQLLVHIKVVDGQATYYTGFAWTKSGQYPTKELWEKYLTEESVRINNPLKVALE